LFAKSQNFGPSIFWASDTAVWSTRSREF